MFGLFKKSGRAKILIVDDEVSLVSTLKDRLEMNEFEVFTAFNGQKGLKKAISKMPDLVLVDKSMPVMDGYEFLELLREHPDTRQISAIMITASDLIGDIDAADKLCVDDYIVKPFNFHDLIIKIERILERKGVIVTVR